MWTSVPQIVVSVTRSRASPGPGRGLSTSSTWNSWGAWKTVARMVSTAIISGLLSCQSAGPGLGVRETREQAGPCSEGGDAGDDSTEAKVTCSGAGAPAAVA